MCARSIDRPTDRSIRSSVLNVGNNRKTTSETNIFFFGQHSTADWENEREKKTSIVPMLISHNDLFIIAVIATIDSRRQFLLLFNAINMSHSMLGAFQWQVERVCTKRCFFYFYFYPWRRTTTIATHSWVNFKWIEEWFTHRIAVYKDHWHRNEVKCWSPLVTLYNSVWIEFKF